MADSTPADVTIPLEGVELEGDLQIPDEANGLVIFAHGSGSSRHSPRNNFVASVLRDHGLGTFLFDLLTEEEDETYETRFDIELLTTRLATTTDWLRGRDETAKLTMGYFGSSTGAAAALRAAAQRGEDIAAVVSRGGRVDLVEGWLPEVSAATLLIVGGDDTDVLELNESAMDRFSCSCELEVIEGAGHLFEGEGELESVAAIAASWFERHLASPGIA